MVNLGSKNIEYRQSIFVVIQPSILPSILYTLFLQGYPAGNLEPIPLQDNFNPELSRYSHNWF